MSWPSFEALCAAAPLPPGVTLRAWREEEIVALPQTLRRWFPTVSVGAESVFLDAEFLRTRVFVDGSEFLNMAICQHGDVVEDAASTSTSTSRLTATRAG